MTEKSPLPRADAYRLLAACFYCPDEVWVEEELFPQLQSVLGQFGPACTQAARALAKTAEETSLTDLAVSYAKLFVGPWSLQAPPYGSCYLDEGGRVMGESTIAIKKVYRTHGLKLDNDFHDLPDHIAVELEFMHVLACKAADPASSDEASSTAAEADEAARSVMDSFLLPFAKGLSERMKAAEDGGPFYQALADCLMAFLTRDRESL